MAIRGRSAAAVQRGKQGVDIRAICHGSITVTQTGQ
jgi:hypothetical protein